MWTELHESFRDISDFNYFNNHDQEEANGDVCMTQWIRAAAVIGMGSDNGSPLNFHSGALWREAKVFVDHGMPGAQVISALTLVNARILDQDKDPGTIESGILADVTVVTGDPLFDMTLSAGVVVKHGEPYKNAEHVKPVSRSAVSKQQ